MSQHDLENPPAPWRDVIWARSKARLSLVSLRRNEPRVPSRHLNENHCATKWVVTPDGTATPVRYNIPWRLP